MDTRAPKKGHQYTKNRPDSDEEFARKVPYRLCWLSEPNPESLLPGEVEERRSLLRKQLPLQKMLVPTRSIPVRGLGAPDFTSLPSLRPPPPRPLINLCQLKLLSQRFPKPAAAAAENVFLGRG
ncbi:uncharacterized protein C3orf22 homolog [Diceros bicornis minor]|nr:uncharacterized protein C3orf22 homolog [Diceros bicornis minor]